MLFTLWDHRIAWSVASGTRQTTQSDRLPHHIALQVNSIGASPSPRGFGIELQRLSFNTHAGWPIRSSGTSGRSTMTALPCA